MMNWFSISNVIVRKIQHNEMKTQMKFIIFHFFLQALQVLKYFYTSTIFQ